MSANIDWLDAAISKYLTGRLAQFRADLEEGTGQSIGTLQADAALLLSDLCRFLGLDEQQHDHVLGESGVQHVMEVMETRVLVRTTLSLSSLESASGMLELTMPLPEIGSR